MKLTHALGALGAAAVATIGLLVVVPAGATPSSGGTQHFTLLSNDPNNNPSIVIAKGPIHAQGTDQQISNTIDKFVFPEGSLRIKHKQDAPDVNTFDPVTCFGTVSETGSVTVVRGNGAYKGATGDGSYKLSIDFIGCDPQSAPDIFQLKIAAVVQLVLPTPPSTSSSSSAPSSSGTSSAPSTSSSSASG